MTVRGQAKSKLARMLFILMEDTPYSRISVSDLCAAAGVERSTFYRNVDSKEDLVVHWISLVMEEHLEAFATSEDHTFETYMLSLFRTLEAYGPAFEALFRDGLGEMLAVALQRSFNEDLDAEGQTPEEQYHLSFHVGGICNHLRLWVERGMVDPPEELARYTVSLFSEDFRPIRLRLMASAR